MALFILPPLNVNSSPTASSPHFACSFRLASFSSTQLLLVVKMRPATDLTLSNRGTAQHTVFMSSSKTPQLPVSTLSTLITTNLVENKLLVSAGKRKKIKGKRVWNKLLALFNTIIYSCCLSSSLLVCCPTTTHISCSGGQQIMFVSTTINCFVGCEVKLVTWGVCNTQQHFMVEYKLAICFSVPLSKYAEQCLFLIFGKWVPRLSTCSETMPGAPFTV